MNRKLLRFHRRVRRASKKVDRDRRPRPALFPWATNRGLSGRVLLDVSGEESAATYAARVGLGKESLAALERRVNLGERVTPALAAQIARNSLFFNESHSRESVFSCVTLSRVLDEGELRALEHALLVMPKRIDMPAASHPDAVSSWPQIRRAHSVLVARQEKQKRKQMRRRLMKGPGAMIVHCSQGGTKSVAWRD